MRFWNVLSALINGKRQQVPRENERQQKQEDKRKMLRKGKQKSIQINT